MNRHTESAATADRMSFWLVLMSVSVVLWIAFAKLVVQPIIESAYRGESLSIFNHVIEGQKFHPVEFYLSIWQGITVTGAVAIVAFGVLVIVVSRPAFFYRFIGEATPGTLGAIRMWICAILLLMTSLEDFSSIALLPIEARNPSGVLGFFYGLPAFAKFVRSENGLWALQLLTELVLVLGLIGWRTRIVIPLAAFCHFLMLGILIDHSFFWHQNLVPLYLLFVLSFTPCGDGWSVDRLLKVYCGRAVPSTEFTSPVYGLSRYACWVTIVWPYLANGVGKLEDGGLYWWSPTNMRSMLYWDSLKPREFNWSLALYLKSAPDSLFAIFGIVALVTELTFGLVLISRIARRILPVAAIMMHLGIFLFQRILFLDLMLLQFVFFDFTQLRKRIGHRLEARRGQLQVLYDGLCPLCRRTIRLLASFDLFHRLEFLDFRPMDLSDYNRTHKLALTLKDLDQEMHLVSQGRTYRGLEAYRVIVLALPAFWPLAPWFLLPGISSVGAFVYRSVARSRRQLVWCDSHCAIQPSGEGEPATIATRNKAQRNVGRACLVSSIILVALLCGFYRLEFYPFTSWHLYTARNTTGVIQYYKVLARYESGITTPARLEDGIGALRFDGRYFPFLQQCFGDPSDIETCKKFLSAEASVYNKKSRPGKKITHYEIQEWRWDFRGNPLDPQHGKLVKRFVH